MVTEKGTGEWHTVDVDLRDGLLWFFWHDLKEGGQEFEVRVQCEIHDEIQVSLSRRTGVPQYHGSTPSRSYVADRLPL